MKKGLFSLTVLIVLIFFGADARSQVIRRPGARNQVGVGVRRPARNRAVRVAPVVRPRPRLLPRLNLLRRGRGR